MDLPIQKFMKKFGNLEFANDFLREKIGLRIVKEPVFSRQEDLHPDGRLYLYNAIRGKADFDNPIVKNASNLVLDEDMDLVSIGPAHVPELTKENEDKVDWTTAYAEEVIPGMPVIAYEYKGKQFLQTPNSPKARDVVPTRNLTYHMAVCYFLMKKYPNEDRDTVLYKFNERYFYYMIYTCKDWLDRSVEALTLVTAVDKMTLKEVDDRTLTMLSAEMNLGLPDFNIISSMDDAVTYLHSVMANSKSDTIIIKDDFTKYKLKGREGNGRG